MKQKPWLLWASRIERPTGVDVFFATVIAGPPWGLAERNGYPPGSTTFAVVVSVLVAAGLAIRMLRH
jgi:hypothetical protein